MSRWSIRWRLTVWNAAVLTGVLVIFSLAMLFMVHRHLQFRADQDLAEEMKELVEELSYSSNQDELTRQLERRFAVHSHYHFQVRKSSGEFLFRSRLLTGQTLPFVSPDDLRGTQWEDVSLRNRGQYRLLTQAMRPGDGVPLLLQVVVPLAAQEKEFQSYVWMIFTLVSGGIGVSLLAGYALSRKALAPIEKINATARRISAEQLRERVVISHPDDELGQLAMTLNEMFDRLGRSIEEMKRFTSDAAHELRSPLAAMRMELEVAQRSLRSVADYQRVLGVTLEEATRLSHLVDQLLTLSRHDSGMTTEVEDEVPIDAVVLDVSDRVRIAAVERGVSIDVSPMPSWMVRGDDIQLSQLFFNLVDNAVKYTPGGGHVRLSAETNGRSARFIVEDTGIGIPPEHLPHIFERFYRADVSRNRNIGGTGLGLAICKSIAEAHHGEIQVESRPGFGTRFTVTLPGHPGLA